MVVRNSLGQLVKINVVQLWHTTYNVSMSLKSLAVPLYLITAGYSRLFLFTNPVYLLDCILPRVAESFLTMIFFYYKGDKQAYGSHGGPYHAAYHGL